MLYRYIIVKLTMVIKVYGRCYTNKREVRSMKLKLFLLALD